MHKMRFRFVAIGKQESTINGIHGEVIKTPSRRVAFACRNSLEFNGAMRIDLNACLHRCTILLPCSGSNGRVSAKHSHNLLPWLWPELNDCSDNPAVVYRRLLLAGGHGCFVFMTTLATDR
jgi:hypothetical protein